MHIPSPTAAPVTAGHHTCQQCPVHTYCISACLPEGCLARFEAIRSAVIVKRRNECLFKVHDRADSLYIVRSGTLKAIVSTAHGDEQITGFYLPGEILGLDALESGQYSNTAVVLQTSSICALPLAKLSQLCAEMPVLQDYVWRLMSRELLARQELQLAMAQRDAEARLAIFLLSMSERMQRLGYSATSFQLPMTRHEIGNYLGLSMETVSRIFSHLQHDGLISRDNRFVKLLDTAHLRARGAGTSRSHRVRIAS